MKTLNEFDLKRLSVFFIRAGFEPTSLDGKCRFTGGLANTKTGDTLHIYIINSVLRLAHTNGKKNICKNIIPDTPVSSYEQVIKLLYKKRAELVLPKFRKKLKKERNFLKRINRVFAKRFSKKR